MMDITLTGKLDPCFLLTFSAPPALLSERVPPPLQPSILGGQGLVSVVACQVRDLRPAILPAGLGFDSWQLAGRVFVQTTVPESAPARGVYFLHSFLDPGWQRWAANWLTPFRFQPAICRASEDDPSGLAEIEFTTPEGALLARLKISTDTNPTASAQQGSGPFRYEPAALAPLPSRRRMAIVTVEREESAWREQPGCAALVDLPFLEPDLGRALRLAQVISIAPISYTWKVASRPL